MGDNLVKFGLLFTAIDQATAPMRKITSAFGEIEKAGFKAMGGLSAKSAELSKNLKGLSDRISKVGFGAAAFGGGALAAVAGPIKAFEELEDATTRMNMAFLDATGKAASLFSTIKRQTVDLGNELPGTTRDFAVLATTLKEMGLTDKIIAGGALRSAAYLKTIFAENDSRKVAEIASGMTHAYSLTSAQILPLMDTMQRAHYAFGLSLDDFKYATPYIARVYGAINPQGGLKAAQNVTAIMGMLKQGGMEGSAIGTSIGAFYKELSLRPSEMPDAKGVRRREAYQIAQKYGIDFTLYNKGQFIGEEAMMRKIWELKKRGATSEEVLKIGMGYAGATGGSMFTNIYKQGEEGWLNFQERMRNQLSLQDKMKLLLGTYKNVLEAAMGTVTNLAAVIGSAMGPALKGFFTKLNDVTSKLQEFFGRQEQGNTWVWKLTKGVMVGTAAFGGLAMALAVPVLGAAGLLRLGGVIADVNGKLFVFARYLKQTALGMRLMEVANSGNVWKALKWNIANAVTSMRTWVAVQWASFRASIPTMASLRQMATTFNAAVVGGIRNGIRSSLLWVGTQWTALRVNYLNVASLKSMGVAFIGTVVTAVKTGVVAVWQWVAAQTAAFRANFLTLSGLRGMAVAFGSNLLSGIRAVTLAVRGFTVALLGTPLGWVAMLAGGVAFLVIKYWKPLGGFFKGLWSGIKEGIKGLEPTWNLFKKYSFVLIPVLAPLKAIWNLVKALIGPVNDTGKSWENAGFRAGKAIGRILAGILDLPRKMLQAGMNIITSLTDGMLRMINKPVDAMKSLAKKLRAFLPFSPAKEGPLKDIHRIRLVETIAEGIKPGPMVKAMRTVTAATMIAATPVMAQPLASGALLSAVQFPATRQAPAGGGAVHITFAPVITVQGGGNPEQVKNAVSEGIKLTFPEFEQFMKRYEDQKQRRGYL